MIDILLAVSIIAYIIMIILAIIKIINDIRHSKALKLLSLDEELEGHESEDLDYEYPYTYTETEFIKSKRSFYRNYITSKRGTGYGAKMKKVKGTYVIKEPRIKFKRKLKRK